MFKTGLERWLGLLVHSTDIDPGKTRYKGLDADLKEVVKIMELFIGTKLMRYSYQRRLDWLRKQEGWKKQAREQGLAEGLAEGKAEGKAEGARERALEDARRLKAHGVDIGVIAECTELSREEVMRA